MCTNCWIWNVNGLGHADHYPLVQGDTVNVAMTMDGSIVADRITTGILTGILIRGISLVLGGMDSTAGTLLIKSGESSGYCTEGRNGGLYFGTLTAISDPDATHPRGSYTVVEHGHIRGDISFIVEGGTAKKGIAINSPVVALDCDELWVTSQSYYSGGGSDAIAGVDLPSSEAKVWIPTGNDVNNLTYYGPYQIRHGIIVGTPNS